MPTRHQKLHFPIFVVFSEVYEKICQNLMTKFLSLNNRFLGIDCPEHARELEYIS